MIYTSRLRFFCPHLHNTYRL